MRPCIAFLAVALLGSVYALDIHSLLDSEPTVDVNAKTCQLTQAQLDSILAGTSTEPNSYILIDSKLSKAFADSAAQLLAPSGFTVCQTTAEEAGLPGDVTIILQPAGKTVVYYGKRNAETLNLAVQKLSARFGAAGGPMFSTITNKMERKAFERLNGAKVVAFFADPIVADAAAFAEFQSAARQLAPNPPFYVVHDTHFAQKLRLTQSGQIALIHRLEKSIAYFQPQQQQTTPETVATDATIPSASAATATEIVSWITKNRGLLLHELDDTNLYDPEVLDPSKYIFAAVADRSSPMGLYFHKLLTKSIQNISRENEIRANLSAVDQTQLPDPTAVEQPQVVMELIKLDDIEIVWIDLQKYPLAAQKIAQSGATQVKKDVYFGLVQVPTGVLTDGPVGGQWFDVSQLQTQSWENTEQPNMQILRDWILATTDRLPVPAVSPEPQLEVLQQEFSLEPEPVNVRQGGAFVLDCKVQYKAGQCGWAKDGELVDVEATAEYTWANEADIYDCSLKVTAADAARDNGEWICQVTDASMPDGTVVVEAIESKPVTVIVRQSAPKVAKKVKKPKAASKGEL